MKKHRNRFQVSILGRRASGVGPWFELLLAARGSWLAALEHSSDREVHSALTGWADTAGDRNRANDGVGDQAEIKGSAHDNRSGIVGFRAEGRAGFVPSAPINFLPDELRHAVEFTAKSE